MKISSARPRGGAFGLVDHVRELHSFERLALALLGGLAVAASFLNFALWPFGWIAFVSILLALARRPSVREAVAVGVVAGLATNVPAFSWLVHTIHLFGGFPLWLSWLFYLGLSLYSVGQFVLFSLAIRLAGLGPAAIFPALFWVTLEFLYPNLFPWRLANSQQSIAVLLQSGDLAGPFGLSLVMVWASAAVARAIGEGWRASRSGLSLATLSVAALVAYGVARLPVVDALASGSPALRVGIVQGNLSIEEKHDVRYFEANLDTYKSLTESLRPSPDVVIWPESVITEPLPRTLRALSPAGREALGLQRPLFAGALTFEDGSPPRLFNSVMLFDADGSVLGLSDKQILMPFGEFMPFGSVLPWLKQISPQTGDFQAGREVVPLDVPGVGRFAPLNCYEDIRASIARRATLEGGAEILFAVANDGWFGDTMAPFQHEALALWRAIENRRYLVRVTNTGVTDVIDPAGRVALRLPLFQPASVVAEVHKLRMLSLYTRIGDTFAWLVTAAALGALWISAKPQGRLARPSLRRFPS
jgi:apolipoprotein N-acyltransferase